MTEVIEKPTPPETVEVRQGGDALPGIVGGLFVVVILGGLVGSFLWVTGVIPWWSDPNQAAMPSEFIEGIMVERMSEGEVGWVSKYDIDVDANRKVWLNDSATVYSEKDISNKIMVKKDGDYFEITIMFDMKWGLRKSQYQSLGYYKVSKISVEKVPE